MFRLRPVARSRRALIPTIVAALAFVSMSTMDPADAAAPERFHETRSEVIEGFCGDLTVRRDLDIRGTESLNAHGVGGLVYFGSRVHGTVSWTNKANDKTFSVAFSINDKDLKVTDNGDGTLTVIVLATGNDKATGPDGKLLFSNPGQVRFELLVDHGGTPTDPDDDVVLEERLIKGSTGRNDAQGHELCDDLHTYIA